MIDIELPIDSVEPQAAVPEPKSVLIAEDDAVYRHALCGLLRRNSFEVTSVCDGRQALRAALSPDAPRLLVLDWVMPGFDGPEVCRQLRMQQQPEGYQYILLLTAKDAKTDIVAGLEAGADDYLTKPFDSHELLARLRVGMRLLNLRDQLVTVQKQLRYQATHDPLTGLWSRRAWARLLPLEMQRAKRNSGSVAVVMVDVDHFKSINDQYGHTTGDILLGEIGRRLSSFIRAYDVAGRYGGDEFIVITTGLSQEKLLDYAERIRSGLAQTQMAVADREISITVSVGVGVSSERGTQEISPDSLVRLADGALYSAKSRGRNCVVLQHSGEYELNTGTHQSAPRMKAVLVTREISSDSNDGLLDMSFGCSRGK